MRNVRDQVANAFRQVHNFAFSLELKLDLIISRSCIIDSILKANQWFDYFARKRESNPNAEQDDTCGNNAQYPFGSTEKPLSLPVIFLHPLPNSFFQSRCKVEHLLARTFDIAGISAERGIARLHCLRDLRVERTNLGAKLVDELGPALVAVLLHQTI